jgi:hypothetical protein
MDPRSATERTTDTFTTLGLAELSSCANGYGSVDIGNNHPTAPRPS